MDSRPGNDRVGAGVSKLPVPAKLLPPFDSLIMSATHIIIEPETSMGIESPNDKSEKAIGVILGRARWQLDFAHVFKKPVTSNNTHNFKPNGRILADLFTVSSDSIHECVTTIRRYSMMKENSRPVKVRMYSHK